jgi:signal transduction histidine kinase
MLSAAKMNVSAMDSHSDEDTKLMNNAKKLIDDSVKEVRSISHNLMPAGLTEKGIVFALNELANKINDTGLLNIELMINSSDKRLDSSVEIAVYRIVQEVVNNMIKHSKANKVEVLLDYNTEKIYLSIKDNGVGFDTAAIENSSGIGWKNIFSRVYMMNGDVQVNSQPGRGTLVNIEFAK